MKGAQFERDISRILSLWWTRNEREDIFWRTSQSGGRATFRARKGLRTFGAYGDITALDPIGVPLLKVFTVELKRGDAVGTPFASLESISRTGGPRPWERALLQTVEEWRKAGSRSWLLIQKRDRMECLVYTDLWAVETFNLRHLCPFVEFSLPLETHRVGEIVYQARFAGMLLEDFLQIVDPEDVREKAAQVPDNVS